jgi:hypothetical protein
VSATDDELNPGGRVFESPPERLETLLRSIVPGTDSQRSQATGVVIAVAVGENETATRRAWYKAYGTIDKMIDDAETFVRARLDNYDSSPYARTFIQIRDALQRSSLDAGWAGPADMLIPLVTAALPFAIHFANQHGAERTAIENGDYRHLLTSLNSLKDEVSRSNLPGAIKDALQQRVAELINAVNNYRIHGAEGIAEAAQRLVVTVTMYEPVKREEGIVKKAAAAVNEVQDLLLKAYALYQIAAPIMGRLLGP